MDNHLKISVAQTSSVKGDVSSNIRTHLDAVETAGGLGVSYIVFPELSLTGYEPELSGELAFSDNDPRLTPLKEAAAAYRIHIVAGAPLKNGGLPYIGELIFTPAGGIEAYSKMNLYPGEEAYFSIGKQYHSVTLGKVKIFNAICADTTNPEHVEHCVHMGAAVYCAGVLISAEGYKADTEKLEHYARKFGLLVAMANHNRPTGIWSPTGKSAIWGPSGIIAAADRTQNALVVAAHSSAGWNGTVLDL